METSTHASIWRRFGPILTIDIPFQQGFVLDVGILNLYVNLKKIGRRLSPQITFSNYVPRNCALKVAEMARKLRFLVVADEVYGHLTFGSTPFVPMGVYGSIVPVVTLGSISKRWCVPGWRLGWLVINDPNGILKESGVLFLSKSLQLCVCISPFSCV